MSIVNQPDVMYYDRSLSIKYFVSSYRIVSLIYFIRQYFLQGVKLNMYFGLIGDPRDGYLYPTLTLMIDSYIPDSLEIERTLNSHWGFKNITDSRIQYIICKGHKYRFPSPINLKKS